MATGFKDMRTAAELLLAPKTPLSRTVSGVSGLKVNLGGPSTPGVITDRSQLAGPVRAAFKTALQYKVQVASFTTSLTTVLTGFDALQKQLTAGTFIPPDPLLLATTTGIPSTAGFLTFSSLAPGQPVPPAFQAIIAQRKVQLQQLVRTFSAMANKIATTGVTLTENIHPTPYPRTDQIDVPDVPRLAQGGIAASLDAIIKDKVRFAVHGVNIGTGKPNFWSRLIGAAATLIPTLNPVVNQVFKDRKNAGSWSEPVTPYAAQFPYNHAHQTEAGHAFELDDTPGAERVHLFHRSGSFIEFHPDGSIVYKSMKHGYRVTMADEHVNVKGSCHVAIEGNSTLYVKGNIDMQTDGHVNVQAKGDYNVYAQNINLRAKKTFKADGTKLDLRYITLPTSIIPVSFGMAPAGFAPRVNMTAVRTDTNVDAALPTPSMDPAAGAPGQIIPEPESLAITHNPLSNWSIYTAITPAAIAYRAKLFDAPEEVNNIELYTGHTTLQTQLQDLIWTSRQLGGTLRQPATVQAMTAKPTVQYLDIGTFQGQYKYDDPFVLANTSFTLADIVDLRLHPDVVQNIYLDDDITEDVPDDVSATVGGDGGAGSDESPDGDTDNTPPEMV